MAVVSAQSLATGFHGEQLVSSLEALHLEAQSTPSSSFPSSPETRPYDLRHSTLEEEDEEETSSEAGSEPITPVDPTILIPHGVLDDLQEGPIGEAVPTKIVTAQTTYPQVTRPQSGRNEQDPRTPMPKRTTSAAAEKPSALKRVMSGLIKRAPSTAPSKGSTQTDGSTMPIKSGLNTPERRNTGSSIGSVKTPPTTTMLDARASIGSQPVDIKVSSLPRAQDTASSDFLAHGRKKNRSTSGFGFRDKFSSKKITFRAAEGEETQLHQERRAHRTTSVDLEPSALEIAKVANPSSPHLPAREVWPVVADTGTGLKARRLSLSLPEEIIVEVCDLNQEYGEQHKLGLRGKTIGKGATANVRLVYKKGRPTDLYAAKEFRAQKKDEKSEDYEKKVKSEYSIAKSLHHLNIVETFNLCTQNGRWTHVMEYCSEGDLFNLVSQKYLSRDDHLSDRICLFKQLVQGLNYLHCHGIAHRDVKLENILLTKEGRLKITDFGVSEVFAGVHPGVRAAGGECGKEMGEIRLCVPGMCGSAPYVAPEVVARDVDYDPRPLDVWGAAVVMLCMTANGVLWQDAKLGSSSAYDDLIRGWEKWYGKHPDTNAVISEVDYPNVSFFDKCINPPALRRLLLTMLNPDPAKRVSMTAVATNRWLKNAECCQPDSFNKPTCTIDASKSSTHLKNLVKIVQHNHLPPQHHFGHRLVRLPGSTAM